MLFLYLLSMILGIAQVSHQMSMTSSFPKTVPDPLFTAPSPYFGIPYPQHRGFFHRRNCIYSPHTHGTWMSPYYQAMILHRLRHAQRNRLIQNLCRKSASERDQLVTRYCNVAKRVCKDSKSHITKSKKHKKCTCKKEKKRNKHLSKRIRKMRKALNKEKIKLGDCMTRLDRERYSKLLPKSIMKYDVNKPIDRIKTSRHELPVIEKQIQRTRQSKPCRNCTPHYTTPKSLNTYLHKPYENVPKSISKRLSYKSSPSSPSYRSPSLPIYKSSPSSPSYRTYRSSSPSYRTYRSSSPSYRTSSQPTKHYKHKYYNQKHKYGKKHKYYTHKHKHSHKHKHKRRKWWRFWKR